MSPRPRSVGRKAMLVFGLALAVRLSILALMAANDPLFSKLRADSVLYLERAHRIASGGFMAGHVFEQAPLYPYLLAPIVAIAPGSTVIVALIIQILLDSLTAMLLTMIASSFTSKEAPVLIAGLLYAFGREPAFFATKLLSTTPLLFFLVLFIYCVTRRSSPMLVTGGVAAGLACLLWPGALIVPLVMALVLARRRPSFGLRFLAACALTIAPATTHNLYYESWPVPICSNGGITIYQGNNKTAQGIYTQTGSGADIATQQENARRLAEEMAGRNLTRSQASRLLGHAAMRWLVSNPRQAALLLSRKAIRIVSGRDIPLIYSLPFEAGRFVPLLGHLPVTFTLFSIALPAALVILAADLRRRLLPLFLIAAALLVPLLLVFVSTRYKLPLFPICCLLLGAASESPATSKRSRLILAMLLLAPGIGLAIYDSHRIPIPLSLYVELADTYAAEGDYAAAYLELATARELNPSYVRARNAQAGILMKARRLPREWLMAPTADLDPQIPGRLAATALLLSERGDRTQACRLARLAFALSGDDPITHRLVRKVLTSRPAISGMRQKAMRPPEVVHQESLRP